MAKSFRDSILNVSEGSADYCSTVFGTWDYGLVDNETITLKHKAIRFELLVKKIAFCKCH